MLDASGETLEHLGLTRSEFISLFNDETKILAEMTAEQVNARIHEMKRAISVLRVHSLAATEDLANRKQKMSRLEREALQKDDAKYKPKIQDPLETTVKQTKEQQMMDRMMKIGLSYAAAGKMVYGENWVNDRESNA